MYDASLSANWNADRNTPVSPCIIWKKMSWCVAMNQQYSRASACKCLHYSRGATRGDHHKSLCLCTACCHNVVSGGCPEHGSERCSPIEEYLSCFCALLKLWLRYIENVGDLAIPAVPKVRPEVGAVPSVGRTVEKGVWTD